MKSLYHFLKPEIEKNRWKLGLLVLFPIAWCFVETLAPFSIKLIIDRVSVPAIPFALLYAFFILSLELSTRICNAIWINTIPGLKASVQTKILSLIERNSYHFTSQKTTGDIVNKYRNFTQSVETIMRIFIYALIPTVASFLFAEAFIAYIQPLYALVFLGWFIAMTLIALLYLKPSIAVAAQKAHDESLLCGHFGNLISNQLITCAFGHRFSTEKHFTELKDQAMASTIALERLHFKADLWRSILSWLLMSAMIALLCRGLYYDQVTLGDFAFISGICFYVRRSIWMTSLQLADLYKESGTIKDALSILEEQESGPITSVNDSTIELKNIDFGYSKRILENINMKITPGQKLGIYGKSGIGKTSLIHLILGVLKPTSGNITIGDQTQADLSHATRLSLFSYAPQQPTLLNRSIFDNIAFGNPNATKEDVIEAARICKCMEFIQDLADGYNTIVGDRGYGLSGGQAQRVALARAYIKKAPILILDEATSNLDEATEKQILTNLLHSLKDTTMICISHRQTTLDLMGSIIHL